MAKIPRMEDGKIFSIPSYVLANLMQFNVSIIGLLWYFLAQNMSKDQGSSPARPSTWNSSRRGQVPKYIYKSIKEIHLAESDSKQSHNVYGVVIDARPPEKSKGSG